MQPYSGQQPQNSRSPRSVVQKIIEPGINSPGPTLVTLLPAVYFVVGDLMAHPNLADANWQQIAAWVALALVGWFSKSHNVSSSSAGVE